MPRGLLALALASLVLAPAAQAGSWAAPQIRTVVEHGLMAPTIPEFRPNAALTRRELGELLAALTQQAQVVVHPARPVTVTQLDAALVRALGLGPAAQQVRAALAAAGLRPPRRLGTEAVARLLRLRFNHPAARDYRELLPNDPVTRADAAYSVARLLELASEDLALVNEVAASFSLPRLSPWQRRILRQAVKYVGYPYVWGGTSERAQAPFGVPSRGGFDCSGFMWRVYKLEAYPGGGALAATLRGRTTFEMSAEVPNAARIPFEQLVPGDVAFFGERGPRSSPVQVDHMGMYLGGGWFVHSSGQGVTLLPLASWYAKTFAWARRPLGEAGLS